MSEQEKFSACMDEKIAACNQRSRILREEGRSDESIFENIRANVYDIFKTVFAAAKKNCKADEAAEREFFMQKVDQISKNWEISYEKCKEHEDVKKMHIEEIKLEAVQEIRAVIKELW